MDCPEAMEGGLNFRLLREEELPQLLEVLTGYLPESLKFHQTLLTYMEDRVWEFHFYVANDWPEATICLHFPGMTLSPHGLLYESVGVFCPNDRLELLKLLREEDVLIDWSKPLYINFVHYDIAEELTRLYEGAGTIERVVGDVCACENLESLEESEESEDDADADVQVLPLKAEHAEGIHELYPANDMECHEVFLRLIRTLPAAGVFANGTLAAWMVQSYYGAMFSMQTKPEYRRKGYGTKLARYLTKQVAEKGYRPFVVIRPENEASQSLYKKLGFSRLYQTVRMTFMPSAWQDAENEANILRDNLENAVRQLTVGQRVVNAFRNDDEDETVQDEGTIEDSDEKKGDEESDREQVFRILNENAENEASSMLRDNLENAVRRVAVGRSVVNAFRNDEESSANAEEDAVVEDTIGDPSKDEDEEKGDDKSGNPWEEELLEPIEEQPEDRIETSEVSVEENAVETAGDEGTPANGDQNDGGTDAGNSE